MHPRITDPVEQCWFAVDLYRWLMQGQMPPVLPELTEIAFGLIALEA